MLCVDIEEILQNLAHTSLLEELYFWAVKYEFPQKLVTFMLSLLPNDKFKVCFETRRSVAFPDFISLDLFVLTHTHCYHCP